MTDEESTSKSITLKLPSRQVSLIDQLKREYGVRSRGQVLEILLEGILGDVDESESGALATAAAVTNAVEETISPEVTSLVLIESTTQRRQQQDTSPSLPSTGGIDLPGFVSRRTSQLRDTLQAPRQNRSSNDAPLLSSVAIQDLQAAAQAADDHWSSLTASPPERPLWRLPCSGWPGTSGAIWMPVRARIHLVCRQCSDGGTLP